MIPIWVCAFWLVAGAIGMLVLFGYATEKVQHVRQRYFRELVKRYPLDYEAALNAHDLMHAVYPEPHVEVAERHARFDPIDFQICKHCGLPWPIADGALEGHPFLDDKGVRRANCVGSGTKDYDVET